ncbi:hypothetical protein LAZ67_15000335 [Cordylochernes scorpioides]|uniref:Endonuclease/exonuclease/phosphatase domain-containing protein n=1 Tax=Cordylochernes scorpioides TaxID=51811 RepID=A0ABY6L808_9ARAC|nr:hypothetical protein LAZ67_15000335 [Cordylochernes scorpioides]
MLTKGVRVHHDNAQPHTAHQTTALIEEFEWELVSHPPYSPDVAPTDFHFFPDLKKNLVGTQFQDDDELKEAVLGFLRGQAAEFFDSGFHKCPVTNFKLSKSHKKVLKRMHKFLAYGTTKNAGDPSSSDMDIHPDELTAIGHVPRWRIGERPSDMKASCETSRITLTNKQSRTNSNIGYGGAVSVLMLESAAKASASMLGTASNYWQSQTFTKVCLDHGAMINESCTPIPHSMRSDVDLHAASPVAQNKQGRVQDLGRGFCPISIIQSPQTSHFATSKQLSILQCNINGLCSTATKIKLEEIMEIAEKQKIQIIALQETKLNEKYNLKYKNYNILRKDRNKEGGGLAFLIKNLYYEDIAINIPNTSDLEAQGIKVYLNQNKTINIFNMYHPPDNKLIDDGTMAQFLTDNTIIVGDLNAKHQLWGCSTPNPRGKILSNLFDDNAFMCLNDGNPTHHSYSYNTAQALDISFSSPDIFHKCKWQILKSIGSDHLPILIEISTKTKTSSIKEKFWNFKKANWNLYQQNQ